MSTRYIAQAWCPDGVMRKAYLYGSVTGQRVDASVFLGGADIKGSCHKGKVPDDYPKPPASWSGWYFFPLTGPGTEAMGYTVESMLETEHADPGRGLDSKKAKTAWDDFDFDVDL
jgi:hypothetical protein